MKAESVAINSHLSFNSNSPGAKYFFDDLLHPLVKKLFLYLEKLHYICNEKITVGLASSW